MAKKAKKSMSKAARSARAKASWAARRLAAANTPSPGGVVSTGVVDDGAEYAALAFSTPGYERLAAELQHAFSQSAHGKGKHRHANGRSFDRQPIMELARLYGPGFTAGQAAKKVQEALQFFVTAGDIDGAIAEVHGGIVYLAATAAALRELPRPAKPAKK